MARGYGRIRPVPDPPLDVEPALAPDFRAYALLAGLLLALGFALFAALVFGVYYALHDVIPSITAAQDAELTAVVGTVEIQPAGTARGTVAQPGQHIHEGDVLRTHDNSRALVTFFDKSTVTLYPATQLTFAQLRANRFGSTLRAEPRTIIDVDEASGRAAFGVAHLNPVARTSFQVHYGSATASLSEGGFTVKVGPNGTFDVVATRGSSVVSDPAGSVTIRGGERTQVQPGQVPEAPILAAEDLISNGSFTQAGSPGQPAGWVAALPAPELNDVPGTIKLTSDDSFSVVRFTRTKSTYHAEQSIKQVINQDVTDYSVVRLDLRFKIFGQSVPGGGDQGSEYPLMVRVNYLDETGAQALFVRGFYVQNDRNLPVTNGQSVKAGEWTDLSDAAGLQLQQLKPRPQFIQSVEVVASGHDYDSEIQKVSLVIE